MKEEGRRKKEEVRRMKDEILGSTEKRSFYHKGHQGHQEKFTYGLKFLR
jgi:hypothetical protein